VYDRTERAWCTWSECVAANQSTMRTQDAFKAIPGCGVEGQTGQREAAGTPRKHGSQKARNASNKPSLGAYQQQGAPGW